MPSDQHHHLTKGHIIFLTFLGLIIVLGLVKWPGTDYIEATEYLPRYAISHYPPKTLMYSAMTLEYLNDTAEFWQKKVGINGFIITTLPTNWYNRPNELARYRTLAIQTNAHCRNHNIDSNFVRISIGHKLLPDYFDDRAWKKILQEVRAVALFAKETGFCGIALDTEAYSKLLWDSSKKPLSRHHTKELKIKIHQRGKELMQAIVAVFPDTEMFVFPEGGIMNYPKNGPGKYELWIHFFNGMMSVHNTKGIVLGCETQYKVHQKNMIMDFFYREIPELIDQLEDPQFWLDRCSVSLGAWPLGREYDNKRAWYSPDQFNGQFRTMEMLCPRYVWIYAHGSSWWQEKDIAKYHLHKEAVVPPIKTVDKYYAVVKASEDPELKRYFYAIKYNRIPSLLEIILGKLLSR